MLTNSPDSPDHRTLISVVIALSSILYLGITYSLGLVQFNYEATDGFGRDFKIFLILNLTLIYFIYINSSIIWIFRRRRDFSPFIIILFVIFLIAVLSFIPILQLFFSILTLAIVNLYEAANIYSKLLALIFSIFIFIVPLPATIHFACRFKMMKPNLIHYRFLITILTISIIFIPYAFFVRNGFPIAASIEERAHWADLNLGTPYIDVSNYIKQCQIIVSNIGNVEKIAPREGVNRSVVSTETDSGVAEYSLEVVGTKASSLINIKYILSSTMRSEYYGRIKYLTGENVEANSLPFNHITCKGPELQ